jgi:DnaJ-class molecular chaperone
MNYYDILGVTRDSSAQDIKSAFRKLAMEHHPDRGGDESQFQKINQAYETLSDPNKRNRYDNEINLKTNFNGNFRSFEDIHDVFNDLFRGRHGFDFGRKHVRNKNLDLNIRCTITLLDSFKGKEIEAKYALPSNRKETVVINIPAGVENNDVIKFRGMGDDTYPQLPRGDLNVTINVADDLNFTRRRDDITTIIEIDPIEAMIGCTKPIETIDGNMLNIRIKPGMTHGGEYAAKGLGFPNIKTGNLGDFIIIVYIRIPAINNDNIKRKLEEIKNAIDNLPK